jgi:tripartite-type tricarboxylate transporter receptor subunit TctC
LRRRAALRAVAAATLAAAGVSAAGDESYPSRPLRLVVPTTPGGTLDLLARLIGDELALAWRVPVAIDNKAGGGGVIGCEAVARAAPDGYTLLVAASNSFTIVPHVQARLPYDPFGDFAPVISIASSLACLVVAAALPVRTLAEFVTYARAHPGELNYASTGVGSAPHLNAELFKASVGINLVHIPYRGSAQVYAALRTGDVHVQFGNIGPAAPFARAGEIRVLAVFADRRSPLLPDVPTAREAGLANLDVGDWSGLFAPAGTPSEAVVRLNAEVNRMLGEPSVSAWLQGRGLERIGGTPDAAARTIRTEYEKRAQLIRRLGIRGE